MLTEADLVQVANDTGFQVEPLGKVERLLALLDGLRSAESEGIAHKPRLFAQIPGCLGCASTPQA